MGWTETRAINYKNGKVDQKAEMDDRWTQKEHDEFPELKVLKSRMVGNIYYAAVQSTKDGKSTVFGVTAITHVNNRAYFNIAYKEASETCGPCDCKCPVSILKLLSPTDNENANDWRKRCYDYHAKQKSKISPSSLPVGTMIRFDYAGKEYKIVKMDPNRQFKRAWWYIPSTYKYFPARRIPEEFDIIQTA